MAYKIAVASTDDVNIDLSFREVNTFTIISVADDGSYSIEEHRTLKEDLEQKSSDGAAYHAADGAEISGVNEAKSSCGGGSGSEANGCGGGTGCGGPASPKVTLIEDCRCVICTQIGFNVQKKLEKKAISSFDIQCSIKDALEKIICYFDRVDHHQTLRGFARK